MATEILFTKTSTITKAPFRN